LANIPCAKFISLTYGASGSKQERSINFARYLISYNPALASKIALHITCIGKSKNDILKIVEEFYNLGIRQFVAVRGDGEIPENGFSYASDLISGIRKKFFDIAIYAAGYPENPHDLDFLHNKISYGVNGIITQICFDAKIVEDFSAKLNISVLPGVVLPDEKTLSFAQKLGIAVPDKIPDPPAFLHNQVQSLMNYGFKHIHFYTLNNIDNLSFLLN
jgi:methylenetetrahydrofolate reductase (NADPH)